MKTQTSASPYKGFRFPAEIISHCVWLYFRFSLSFRDIEEMMAERGVVLTYETIKNARCAVLNHPVKHNDSSLPFASFQITSDREDIISQPRSIVPFYKSDWGVGMRSPTETTLRNQNNSPVIPILFPFKKRHLSYMVLFEE